MQINRNNSIITTISIAEIPETDCSYFLIDGVKAHLDSYDEKGVTLLLWDARWNEDEHDINNWTAEEFLFEGSDLIDVKAVFEE